MKLNFSSLFKKIPNPSNFFSLLSLVLVSTFVLLSYKLIDLVPFTHNETAQNIGSADKISIIQNALYGPTKVAQLVILKITENDAYIRFASVLIAIASAYLLYMIIKRWHTPRVAAMTSFLFICSTWFLQLGRSSNTEILYALAIPALITVCLWLLNKKDDTKLPLSGLLIGLTLYVPGVWLFLLAGTIYFRKYLTRTFKKINTSIGASALLIFLATLTPLVYSLVKNPDNLPLWLGFDTTQVFSWQIIVDRLLLLPDQLFVNGFSEPIRWLSGTPILDVFTATMLILGFYSYRAGNFPAREKLINGSLILAVILILVGNIATVSLLIPILYLVVANGIAYMLQSWFTVFPNNPFARRFGIVAISLAILVSCSFQLQRYFVAWPEAEATKQAQSSEG